VDTAAPLADQVPTADLLLLTEVLATVEIPGLNIHLTEGEMQPVASLGRRRG
jgi:hypothetical protein